MVGGTRETAAAASKYTTVETRNGSTTEDLLEVIDTEIIKRFIENKFRFK